MKGVIVRLFSSPLRTRKLNFIKRAKRQLQASLAIKPSPLQHVDGRPFIFVHINKTGGTSVGNAIGLALKNHQTAKEIIKRIGQEPWESAFKFTFVRNPWDRIVSLYKYRLKKNKTQLATRNLSFEQWVDLTIGAQQDTFYYDNPKSFQPQVDWLKDQQGAICIDVIGRFEHINSDFDKISKELGLNAQLPHLNASSRVPYPSFYNSQSRETVARWYHEDIQAFNYQFDS